MVESSPAIDNVFSLIFVNRLKMFEADSLWTSGS